jgi:sialic acid synthase SpsE
MEKITRDKSIFVVAEMAWSHDGSIEKAKKIIKGAAEAGANAVNFQMADFEESMVENYGCVDGQTLSAGREKERIFDYLNRINFKDADWQDLFVFARNCGLEICGQPTDMKSLDLCKKLNPDIYVVSAACFLEENLVTEIARQKKPVILRIGGATLGEMEKVVNLIKNHGTNEIVLLHGIQLYPTKPEDTNLNLIPSLKKIFGLPLGVADHIDADSELAFIIPLLAIPLGVKVIEKHITHDRSLKGEDFEAALNPDELKKFVSYVREAEKSLGNPDFRDFSEAELKYRKVSRKRMVAAKDIQKNEKLTPDKIAFKRADDGASPAEFQYFEGRTAARDIKRDEPLTWDKIF